MQVISTSPKKAAVDEPLCYALASLPYRLTMVAGTLKMSLKWFIPSIVIGRGIGVATIVFGVSIVPFDKFTTPWHWIIFILLCALGIAAVFFAASRFNKFMEKKRNANKVEEAETEKETEKV